MDKKLSDDWLSLVHYGQIITRQWLLNQGATEHALDNAVKSKKLKVLSRGVLARYEVPISWQGVVASLNRMDCPVYVGGISALSEHGLAHYLDFSKKINLYSPNSSPSWLNKVGLDTELIWHSTKRLWDISCLRQASSLKKMGISNDYWLLASAEQAILEVLVAVPNIYSFSYADNLIQGMVNLSPRRLDGVLKACNHIKAKRLFFFFADRYAYPWRQRIYPENYDLGSGKRSIITGGRFNKEYKITIPKEFNE